MLDKLEHFRENLGGEKGLTIDQMIEQSQLGEREFRAMYLDWVDGALSCFLY